MFGKKKKLQDTPEVEEMKNWSPEDFENPEKIEKHLKKQKRMSRRQRRRDDEKEFIRAEDLQKALEKYGDDPEAAKILSAYIPNRRAKRIGAALLRMDRLMLALLALLAIIIILFIMAFTQEKMGNFTINLDRLELYRRGVSISTDGDFTDPTAKLEASAVQDATNTTLADLPDNLDEIDGDHNGRNYVAYTYYVRNAGKEDVKYVATVDIENTTKGADKAARVAVWKNGQRTIYGAVRQDGKTEPDTVAFETDTRVCSYQEEDFKVGNVDRYTVAIWLEGEDPDCNDGIIGGSLQFAMNIDAVGTEDTGLLAKFVRDVKESVFGGKVIGTSGSDVPDYYHNEENITWDKRRNKGDDP